jgi:hypothetical protein
MTAPIHSIADARDNFADGRFLIGIVYLGDQSVHVVRVLQDPVGLRDVFASGVGVFNIPEIPPKSLEVGQFEDH